MIAQNLAHIRNNILTTALKAGRNPEEITLIVISKGYSIEQILEAYALGCRHFGEGRLQDALKKIPLLPKDIQWHFVGPLQKNKISKVLDHFTYIHSVDSFALAQAIAIRSQRITKILLEVNCSGEASKGGFSPKELVENFAAITSLDGLDIQGLMTLAPFTTDMEIIRNCFVTLRKLRDQLQKELPSLNHLSMGMSHDYQLAIEEGATFLRIGRALVSA